MKMCGKFRIRGVAFVLMLVGVSLSLHGGEEKGVSEVEAIFDQYLGAVHPKGPSKGDAYNREMNRKMNEARVARRSVLADLKGFPMEAVVVGRRVLFERASAKQRYEIVSVLGQYIHTRECADLLGDVIADVREVEGSRYEELVRRNAVHSLRMMGRRTAHSGGSKRITKGADFEPEVPGLVPYMISAANDPVEGVRLSALWALADSRDPAAVAELRNRLRDWSEKVRLRAACFLTEYRDAAGLPEMREALERIRKIKKIDREDDFSHYSRIEMLLASFERITGKSFGEIPMNPTLSSLIDPPGKKRYKELLDTWDAWWAWQPDGQESEDLEGRCGEGTVPE